VPISTKLRVTDGTAKKTYEQLVLVPGLRQFLPVVIMLSALTPPPLTLQLFLDFLVFLPNFFPECGPSKIHQHLFLWNLADSP